MRKLSLTKAEHALLTELVGAQSSSPVVRSVAAKLTELVAPTVTGIASGPLEAALIGASRGKVVPLNSGMGYARASKSATQLEVTVEQCKVVGDWLARQGWLRGTLTLIDVLAKWPQWHAKAVAEVPPSITEGFDELRTGTTPASPGFTPGRRKPGFG